MEAMQITMFDYAALDAETRIVVQQRTTEIKALMKRAASDIIEIGQKLIEVKARLGHGQFSPWLEAEFGWKHTTAWNFMQVATKFSKFESLDGFAPSALYLLAAPSTPDTARFEAVARAEEGETITHSLARGIVHDHKSPALPFSDEDAGPLTPYEEEIAAQYAERYAAYDEPEIPVVVQSDDGDRVAVVGKLEPRGAPINFTAAASIEWYTPTVYIEAARAVMGGFDTDPASNETAQGIIQAHTYYTEETNGLDKPWRGRVWLNPPYGVSGGRAVASIWTERLIRQFDAGITTEAILLVNAVIDSKWFDPLWRFPMCLTNHRIRFGVPAGTPKDIPNSPVIGSAFVYLGSNVAAFAREFARFGAVVTRLHTYDDQVFTELETNNASDR